MGTGRGAYGGTDTRTGFYWETRSGAHLENLGVDGNIKWIWILNKQVKDNIYRIYVAQNKNILRALVKQVMKLRFP
jgi:hypothetical protein